MEQSDMEQSEGWSAGETVGTQGRDVSTTKSLQSEPSKPRTGLVANHDNAIFDVKWSDDDAMIISTCADLSTGVWDTSRTGTTYEQSDRNDGLIARLRGHKASAKTSLWQGPSESSCYVLRILEKLSIDKRFLRRYGRYCRKRRRHPYL